MKAQIKTQIGEIPFMNWFDQTRQVERKGCRIKLAVLCFEVVKIRLVRYSNGTTPKSMKGDFGEIRIETPRDRNGSFDPQIVQKHQTRFDGFDDKILSLYARGMTRREIQGHLQEIYGVEVSPTLVSEVTDAVLEEVKTWQNRPLEPLYSILFLDALYVKMRHEGRVENARCT